MKNETHIEKFRDFLQDKSEMTIYTYVCGVKCFLSYIDKNADDITNEDIQRYKTHMKKELGYSNNSLTVRYASIKKFYKYLGKPLDDEILKNPKRKKSLKIPLTEEEIQRLFEVSKEDKRNHAILKVLYYTGLRRAEVVNLNVNDINTKEEILYVYDGKGDTDGAVNIHPKAVESVVEYIKVRQPRNPNDTALFLNQDGNRLGRQSIHRIVKKYASISGITTKRVYPHLFRITLATHMAEHGCSLEVIRRQLRHEGFEVLKVYIQMSPKSVRGEYLKGISLTQETPKPQPEVKKPDIQPQETTPIHKPDTTIPRQEPQIQRQETNPTDKYIQLLRDGLIDKADFLKLMSGNKMETDGYIY